MRISYTSVCSIPDAILAANIARNAARGLPPVGGRPAAHSLAVVGSGPSVAQHIAALRDWDGDVWAINTAHAWCIEHGIDATFYAVDAHPVIAGMTHGARRAVLALRCDPSVFDALGGVPCETFDGLMYGPSAATTAALVAIARGHRSVTFFGCDSSLSDGVEGPRKSPLQYRDRLLVKARGAEYLTNPGLYMQAEYLSEVIRSAPHVYREASGGLLAAMVADPDYDVIAASRSIHDAIARAA